MSDNPSDKLLQATIEWIIPDDLKPQYANQITVQNTPSEFYISFFHLRPPFVLEGQDLSEVRTVRAECMAQIVISPDQAQRLLETLAKNLERYQQTWVDTTPETTEKE
jgi:hypothetical protein